MTLNKKWLLSLSLALFIALLTACGNDEGSGGDSNNEEAQQEESSENSESSQEGEGSSQEGENSEQPQMPEPDLEGVPEVVATVNGEEIPKKNLPARTKASSSKLPCSLKCLARKLIKNS